MDKEGLILMGAKIEDPNLTFSKIARFMRVKLIHLEKCEWDRILENKSFDTWTEGERFEAETSICPYTFKEIVNNDYFYTLKIGHQTFLCWYDIAIDLIKVYIAQSGIDISKATPMFTFSKSILEDIEGSI